MITRPFMVSCWAIAKAFFRMEKKSQRRRLGEGIERGFIGLTNINELIKDTNDLAGADMAPVWQVKSALSKTTELIQSI